MGTYAASQTYLLEPRECDRQSASSEEISYPYHALVCAERMAEGVLVSRINHMARWFL